MKNNEAVVHGLFIQKLMGDSESLLSSIINYFDKLKWFLDMFYKWCLTEPALIFKSWIFIFFFTFYIKYAFTYNVLSNS